MADVKYDATGQQIEPVEITHVGGTAQTGRDLSLDLKALVDDSIKGLLRSIGDPGAAPLNTTGKTLLYNTAQVEAFLSYIRSALFLSDRTLATSTPLANGAVYTSASFNAYQSSVGYIEVMVKTDKNGKLDVEQSWDDSNWDLTEQTAIVGGATLVVKKQLYAKYVHYKITNDSGADQTYLRAGHSFSIS